MNINSAQMADLLNMAQVEKLKSAEKNGELRESCADFESVLLNYMFQSMKKTVGNGGVFGECFQRNMYESLYIEKIAEKIAEERDLGIGDSLYRQLTAHMGDENTEREGSIEATGDQDA